jgi:AraC-like DNA-binding protein
MRESTSIDSTPEDMLSYFLETVHIKVVAVQTLHLKSPWSLRIANGMTNFYIVANGQCCLRIDEKDDTFTLASGDLAVLPYGEAHSLHDAPSQSVPIDETCDDQMETGTALKTTLLSGAFKWDPKQIADLVPEMPSVIHIKHKHKAFIPWMISTVAMITNESATGRPGARMLINDLAHVIFVQGIRYHLATTPSHHDRLHGFLNDSQIRTALYLMRTHLEEAWSVASIAKRCGMSRSAFAKKFTAVVGKPPMEYLLALRMNWACDLLSKGELRVKQVSELAGYGSQPAFNNAFRRWTGVAPGTYRKTHFVKPSAGAQKINGAGVTDVQSRTPARRAESPSEARITRSRHNLLKK